MSSAITEQPPTVEVETAAYIPTATAWESTVVNSLTRADSIVQSNPNVSGHASGGHLEHVSPPMEQDDFVTKRQLRPQGSLKRACLTTWMDTDDTGDYDPEVAEAQERRKRARRPRAKVSKAVHGLLNDESCEGDGQHEGAQFAAEDVDPPGVIITLTFPTRDGKLRFRTKLEELDRAFATRESEVKGYQLRKRDVPENNQHHVTFGGDDLDELSTNLANHPIARGCRACLQLLRPGDSGHHCSLLDDEREWPCQLCVDGGEDCQLITPPVRKKACERCKARKVPCSFPTTRNHGASCQECARRDDVCVAGPVLEFIQPRIRLGRDYKQDRLTLRGRRRMGNKKQEDCLECVESGKPCKYEPDRDGHFRTGCVHCAVQDLPCTFYDGRQKKQLLPDPSPSPSPPPFSPQEPSPSTSTRTDPQASPRLLLGRDPTPDLVRDLPLESTLLTISTSFSHPIIFNCDHDGPQPHCHFCLQPAFSIYGFGRIRADVIDDPSDGHGYRETSGTGHAARDMPNTRLCGACTTARMAVLMCDRHQLRLLAGADASAARNAAALRKLLVGDVTAADVEACCSLCLGLASYECRAASEAARVREGDGCGLRLCRPCAVRLEGAYRGDLAAMIRVLRDEPVEHGRGLRADHEFLTEDGALVRFLRMLSLQG